MLLWQFQHAASSGVHKDDDEKLPTMGRIDTGSGRCSSIDIDGISSMRISSSGRSRRGRSSSSTKARAALAWNAAATAAVTSTSAAESAAATFIASAKAYTGNC
jgi:hypothetical protein